MFLTVAFWAWMGLCAVGSVVGLVGIAKNLTSIARVRADDRNGFTSHLVGVAEPREPDINQDPLAIEINKAYKEKKLQTQMKKLEEIEGLLEKDPGNIKLQRVLTHQQEFVRLISKE